MDKLLPLFAFLSVTMIACFSFVTVAVWSDQRRREREAYYRYETVKKIAESPGSGNSSAVEFLREEEKVSARRRRETQKLGGLITSAVGLALMGFIKAMDQNDRVPAYLVGLIPLMVGVALLAYAYLLGPKE